MRGAVDQFVAWAPGPTDRTLLVVHGGPDWDHTYLRHPLGRSAGHHRLLLPDLRGCGRSARGLPPTAVDPDTVVADLIGVLDAFEADRADVLGFSYGGLLAQRLAVTAPERIGRLIIASSSVLPVPPANAVWSDLSRTGPARTEAAAHAEALAGGGGAIPRLTGCAVRSGWWRCVRSGGPRGRGRSG
ncbi:alpha/beta fold hydrolase [Nocardia sp. SSK8]|uniref:alpha/beta fold hydrolase n=1 Tax=Nocardia sp. SSK8 TaxID=3120154 RepID=UPI003FA604B9